GKPGSKRKRPLRQREQRSRGKRRKRRIWENLQNLVLPLLMIAAS
ncbi:MAG: hypothetical protein ACFFDT_06935, partial [Candidatus Hodarchaeota archaeon]